MQKQARVLEAAAVTPISPFKPSTRLLSASKNNNGLSTRCLLIHAAIHMIIAVTLIILYIQALIKDFFYANLLCYNEDNKTGDITPCYLNDKEIATVYNASILNLMTDLWQSKDYHISIILFFISFIFPFIHIINNLRMAFKQNTPINVKKMNTSSCSSIICECLNKLPMLYLFGCILFINGLYQSTSTSTSTDINITLYQKIVIEADIAVNILIIAVIISSIWSIYIQFGVNNHHLFGHYRYIHHENNSVQFILIGFFIIIAGILVIITYFMGINFIIFEYHDDWTVYNTIFDDEERKYNLISIIQDIGNNNNKDNNGMLIGFYYLFVFIIPIICYIGYIVLCLVLKYYQYQIKKVLLMTLFYLFLCFNGLDMLLITSIVIKYILPSIWDSIIDTIYKDFCDEFIIINNDQLCDDLTVNVTFKDVMWIGAVFIVILLIIFCLMNDFKCSKHIYTRYKKTQYSDTWDYRNNTLTIPHHHRSSTRNSSINDNLTTESEIGLSTLIIPYSSTSNTQ